MTPQALGSPQSLKQVEAGAQQAMTLNPQRGADGIQAEGTTCREKSHCLRKWSSNSASSMAPRPIVGAQLLWSLTEEGMMIENFGKRYGMYTEMSCRAFGGESLGSRS